MNRLERKFKELKKESKKAFIAFITAGYPNLAITEKLVLGFAKIGVDIIELGVPFSDPLADGPIIQESSQAALKKNTNLNNILNLVKKLRKNNNLEIPICLMTYYNPIFCFGEGNFVRKAKESGIDGVIIPDLPPEEGKALIAFGKKFDFDTVFFLAPTSSLKRIKLVSRACTGFIYYVSLTGVTGPRHNLPPDLISNIKLIKRNTAKPVCVGFGVSEPSQVRQIYNFADGVIVGSAIVKKIKENMDKDDLAQRVVKFVGVLKQA